MAEVGASRQLDAGSKRGRLEANLSGEQQAGPSGRGGTTVPTAKKAKIDALWQQLNSNKLTSQKRPATGIDRSMLLEARLNTDPRASSLGGLSMIVAGLEKKPAAAAAAVPRKKANISSVQSVMAGLQTKQAGTSSSDLKAALLAVSKAKEPTPPIDVPASLRPASKGVAPAAPAAPPAKPASGLDAVLAGLTQKKTTVLGNTKQDWKQFKEADADVNEELESYKKSNNKYLDKVQFLKQAELREYELERDERYKKRPIRSDAPPPSP